MKISGLSKLFCRGALAVTLSTSLAVGCGGDDGGSDDSEADDTSGAEGEGEEGGTEAGTEGGTEAGTDDAADTTEDTGTPMPNGAACTEDANCESGKCFIVPILGGLCGECTGDADCDGGGCSIPNPLAGTGSECNDGALGEGCETDDVCQEGLMCSLVLDVAGVISISTCSNCQTDDDCDEGLICNPAIRINDFAGELTCVEPGTVANGEACVITGPGTGNDAVCESGQCAVADVMGLVEIGVCSDCNEDTDCADGETCAEPDVDIGTGEVTPSVCTAGE